MDYRPRVSRQERQRRFLWLRWLLVAIAAIACVAVIFYRFQNPIHVKTVAPAAPIAAKSAPPPNLTAIADSLVLRGCRSFGLSDSISRDSTLAQISGPTFHCFSQAWPAELPFLVFAQRLSSLANQRNLQCDCLESKQGWLDCAIRADRQTGSRIILGGSRDANLADREMAIVFDNLGAMKKEDIIKLIKSGVVFSYFGADDFYPTGDLARLFPRGNITAILQVSGDSKGLKMLGQTSRTAKSAKKGKSSGVKPVSTGMLAYHPGATAITFDKSSTPDPKSVNAILDMAKRARLSYLSLGKQLDAVDQLALENGITVVSLNLESSDKPLAQFKFDLISELLSEDAPHQIAFYLDASKVDVDELVAFRVMLSNIGVKFRPYMKLTQKAEAL